MADFIKKAIELEAIDSAGDLYGDDDDLSRDEYIERDKGVAFAYPAGDVRITFDTDIRGTLYPYGLFEEVGTDALGSTEQVLMEVKYTGFLPDMIAETLKKADELSTSHSKYSRARMM